MRVWIVTVGEPLPFLNSEERLHRSGMLAHKLIDQGHDVVWWGSTFNHFTKRHEYESDMTLVQSPRFRLELLHGCGYSRNVSFQRMKDHRIVAKKFADRVRSEEVPPDVIVSSFPTIELCLASVKYGKKRDIPVLLDVRDLWPDIFAEAFPRPLRPLGRMALLPLIRQTRAAFSGCHGVIGISEKYLEFGLRYAQRKLGPTDRVFPLGYEGPKVSLPVSQPPTELSQFGIQYGKKVCWFIGTLGRTYDLEPVLLAARRLEESGREDLQFVISGTGENLEKYKKLAEGLNCVSFTGWINSLQISQLMAVATIGLAAYSEGAPQGLPNKFFEYLSAGIPMLSSLSGEGAQLISQEGVGLNYQAGSHDDFAEKLSTLLDSPDLLAAMSLRGKALFDQKFSTEVIYPNFVGFLQHQLSNSARSGTPSLGEPLLA